MTPLNQESLLGPPLPPPADREVELRGAPPSLYGQLAMNGRPSSIELALVLALLSGVLSVIASLAAADPSWWSAVGIGTAANALCLLYTLRLGGFGWQSGPVAYLYFKRTLGGRPLQPEPVREPTDAV